MMAYLRTSNLLTNMDVKHVISRGCFGAVYKVARKSDGKFFALKQVQLGGMSKPEREECIDEARILSRLQHPFLVKYEHSYVDKQENTLNILMEYAAGGSVHDVVKRGEPMSETDTWKLFIQCLLALNYVHSMNIIHRDIKSLNIFLDAAGNVRLGDFGIARCLSYGSEVARTIVGTPFYLSPELCNDMPYNQKSDVWALGVILYECCTGKQPFTAQNEGALIRKIMRGEYSDPAATSLHLTEAIRRCLTYDSNKRPDTGQLLDWSVVKLQAKTLGIDIDMNMKPIKAQSLVGTEAVLLDGKDTDLADFGTAANEECLLTQKEFDARKLHDEVAAIDLASSCKKDSGQPATTLTDRHKIQPCLDLTTRLNQQKDPTPHHMHEDHPGAKPESVSLKPETLPPAGLKTAHEDHQVLGPGTNKQPEAGYITMSQRLYSAAWNARLEAPHHARRRCPDLQAFQPKSTSRSARLQQSRPQPHTRVNYAAIVTSTSSSYEKSCAPTCATKDD